MTKPLGQLSQNDKSEKPEIRETYWTSTEKESLKEMYDRNGNIVPDEIVAFRFENYDNNSEEDDD